VQTAVLLSVVMARPSVSWIPPASISAGTPLSASELNATASVPGTFSYKPALGEVLPVGKHSLTVTLTPGDSMNYEPVKAAVPLTVTELEKVEINWPAPEPVRYGTSLSEQQLNATTSVPGTFAYGPSKGNVLPPGKHTLVAVFTPDDPHTYAVTNATVLLKVDALPDVSSLLTAHTQGPIGREVMDQALPEINEREEVVKKSSAPERLESVAQRSPAKEQALVVERVAEEPVVAAPRETRAYKGVVYEKGDDGQWHRQQK